VPVIGVSLAVPEPWGSRLQEFRVANGDAQGATIPTHITLVPPVEIEQHRMSDVECHLDAVAAASRAYRIHLRGSGTFRPISPVVFVNLVAGISPTSSSSSTSPTTRTSPSPTWTTTSCSTGPSTAWLPSTAGSPSTRSISMCMTAMSGGNPRVGTPSAARTDGVAARAPADPRGCYAPAVTPVRPRVRTRAHYSRVGGNALAVRSPTSRPCPSSRSWPSRSS
jgi:hypothetical protein